jgi:hypothetical protein
MKWLYRPILHFVFHLDNCLLGFYGFIPGIEQQSSLQKEIEVRCRGKDQTGHDQASMRAQECNCIEVCGKNPNPAYKQKNTLKWSILSTMV